MTLASLSGSPIALADIAVSGGTLSLTNANIHDNPGLGVTGVPGSTINLDGCFLTDNNGAFGLTNSKATPADSNGPPNQYDNVDVLTNSAFVAN